MTFPKCLDVTLQGRKVPPCLSEGIGFDTCLPKPRLGEQGQGALKGIMCFSCSLPVKVRPLLWVLGQMEGFEVKKPAWSSVREVFLRSCMAVSM